MSENKKSASGAGNTTDSKDEQSTASVAQPKDSVNPTGQCASQEFSIDWDLLADTMKRLKPITSTSDIRPLFQGIHFQVHTDGRILATALDGYRQASVLAKCFEAPKQYLDFTILPFDVPKRPKCSIPLLVNITVSAKKALFQFTAFGTTETRESKKLDGEFLDLTRILPNDETEKYLYVNPRYLIDGIKAIMGQRSSHEPIKLQYYGPYQPLVLLSKHGQEAMVLPVNASAKDADALAPVLDNVRTAAQKDVMHLE